MVCDPGCSTWGAGDFGNSCPLATVNKLQGHIQLWDSGRQHQACPWMLNPSYLSKEGSLSGSENVSF